MNSTSQYSYNQIDSKLKAVTCSFESHKKTLENIQDKLKECQQKQINAESKTKELHRIRESIDQTQLQVDINTQKIQYIQQDITFTKLGKTISELELLKNHTLASLNIDNTETESIKLKIAQIDATLADYHEVKAHIEKYKIKTDEIVLMMIRDIKLIIFFRE